MSKRLANAISSVSPDSLPGDSDNLPADLPDPGPAPGEQSGEGDKGGGRTVDNVRGELTRKMEREREYFTGRIASLESKIDQLLTTAPTAAPNHNKQPNTLDDMSITELKQLRAQVPAEQKDAFEEYFEERRVREQVENQVKAITNKQSFAQQEQDATTRALGRWPDLRDPTSELYRATNKILSKLGKSADSNPRAILDAANDAGLELGLAPRDVPAPSARKVKRTAPGRSNAPVDDVDSDLTPSKQELETMAARLSGGMKGQKFTEEQLARIAKNTALYRQSRGNFGPKIKG